jgi:lipoate-protein ligase A
MDQDSSHYRVLAQAPDPDGGPLADEALLTLAADGPMACLWQAPQGLVVPRTYAARPGFAQVQARFAAEGWPIHVRQSGGGIVPQGPGILNLSLAQPFRGRPLDHADELYRHLCAILQAALQGFGIATRAQAVEGSFCDGRYNLAVPAPVRKVMGTAQVWRHAPGRGPEEQIGLVHALILACCDPAEATARANAVEAALGSDRRYRSDRAASLDRLLAEPRRPGFTAALDRRLRGLLALWPTLAPADPGLRDPLAETRPGS